MSDKKSSGTALIAAGLAIGLGLTAGGYFVSRTMVNQSTIDTAEVKGLAERSVVADKAIWAISYKVSDIDLKAGYAQAERATATVRAFLADNGFKPENILSGQTSVVQNEYRDPNGMLVETRYDIVASLVVTTNDVKAVDAASQKTGDLIAAGLLINDATPRYLFTGLNAIKPEMLREAAQNARLAAEEFAKNAGVDVGKIRTAAQGGFEIRDTNSGEYGGDDRSIDKAVRVVTNVTFYLN
jgi:hypothetical protein